ncbi:sugar phosphate isomerase/epimerase [Streptomyces sp. TLI_171]|uniref:sugar phosphate isomerase/epimerase family protein n=1 Tax=Streptomyces sp. TLI_171 TaxID=1938859 RepID=UPI000C672466|nr:sugar phosphate isomerase/epimerase family protein [Streptomyces sp. TLI_171]RKE18163.1 sugar phosphate isomerase/epimerase [Streptomyces sp. TLI_171]
MVRFGGIGDEAAPDLAGQLDALDRLGWDELELRTVDGVWIADLPVLQVRELGETLAARRVRVSGLASRIGNWSSSIADDFDRDLRELSRLAVCGTLLGTQRIRVMSYPNAGLPDADWRRLVLQRMRILAEEADAQGMTVLHENCSGWAGTSAERTLDLLASVDHPALRLLFDAGNGVPHGYDAFELLRQVIDQVEHVHIKDAVTADEGTEYVLPGQGEARLAESLRLLTAAGWSGTWSLEPHLAARPHDGRFADGATESGFVAAGRALTALVEREVLPAVPGWSLATGGLIGPVPPPPPEREPGWESGFDHLPLNARIDEAVHGDR